MAKKKQTLSQDEINKMALERSISDAKKGLTQGTIPLNPTRSFKPGDRVKLGAHKEVYVVEPLENGLLYIVRCLNVQREKDAPPVEETRCVEWQDLLPYREIDGTSNFRQEEDLYIRNLNGDVTSLLYMVYGNYAGVDFDVDYQREHVWTLEDKVALIDSIFNNVDIGKFLFAQRRESHPGKYYEIIDGKQRLTALCEFYEDRFRYKGYLFSELSSMDRNKFENHGVAYGYLENPTTEKIYKSFIKLNTCGKPMDTKHLDKVRKLLEDLK